MVVVDGATSGDLRFCRRKSNEPCNGDCRLRNNLESLGSSAATPRISSECCGGVLYNVTNTSLLARASVWMSTEPSFANEPFNVTNGDVFRWDNMWPVFTDYFRMNLAQPQKIRLTEMMADKAGL